VTGPRFALALTLFVPLAAWGSPPKGWKQAFARAFESANSWERREAIGLVDPDDKAGAKLLLTLLAEERLAVVDWHVRDAVISRLAEARSKAASKVLVKGLKAKQARVREGVVLALGRGKAEAHLGLLLKASRDPAPRVQRAAVEALAAFPDRPQAIGAVLRAWEGAPAISRLGLVCERSLAWMASEDHGLAPTAWRAWWDGVKTAWPTQAPSPDEEEAAPMRTRVRGVELTFTERGSGDMPLLVIPNYATTTELYRPWLKAIEDVYRVIYMELPKVEAFPADQIQEYAEGMPYYPVDLLVEAFEELRQAKGVERFALFAHGYNSLIAMRYLSLHAEQVDHAILVAPISGGQAWGQILDGVQRQGQATTDPELTHMARNMLVYPDGKRDYETGSDAEWQALRRKAASLYLADANDPALSGIFDAGFYDDQDEDAVTPDFELSRQTKARVPILLQWGERSLWSLERDQRKFRDHYPETTTKTYADSAMCPFIEQTAQWSEDVHAFFAARRSR
jgi:pimeloyl-ACP methyl ester carboxylesterase